MLSKEEHRKFLKTYLQEHSTSEQQADGTLSILLVNGEEGSSKQAPALQPKGGNQAGLPFTNEKLSMNNSLSSISVINLNPVIKTEAAA